MESFSADTNSTDLHSTPLFKPQDILAMVMLSLTCLLGLPGNGLVLWVAGLKMRRTVNTVWFLHLTLADFLCCLSLPFSLSHMFLPRNWPYGWFLCKFIPSIIVLNMFASVFLLTAISLDRCLMVYKPIWCQNHRNVRTAFIICGCVWVVAFVMCIPVFNYRELSVKDNYSICSYNFDHSWPSDYWDYVYNLDLPESSSTGNSTAQLTGQMDDRSESSPFQTSDRPRTATSALQSQTFQRSSESLNPSPDSSSYFYHPELSNIEDYYYDQLMYGNHVSTPFLAITITRLVVGFLVPFFIMVACYSFIVFRIRKNNFTKTRSKTFRVALVVVTVFFVCWTPYHIVGILSLFADPETPLWEAVISWDHMSIALASANSCFNPFLYAFMGKDFRKKARQSIKGILEAAFSEELTHSTSCTQDKASSKRNMSTDV